VKKLEDRLEQIRKASQDPSARMTDLFRKTRTREQQVPIIDALTNNVEGQFQVNVPNNAIDGIDADVVVEVPAIINGKGIQPLNVGRLPKKIMLEQLLPTILRMEQGLEAYRTGDRSMLQWSVLENGQTKTYEQAYEALEDLLSQAGNEDLASHFSYPWPDGHESLYVKS